MAASRLTIRLDSHLRRRLGRLARQQAKRASELVREALESFCQNQEAQPTCFDIAQKAGLIGAARELPPDLSTNPQYLEGLGPSR